MRVVLAIPGHLRTVPMGHFTEEALRGLGHEVTMFDYAPSRLDKVREQAPWHPAEEWASVNRRLRRAIEASQPDLFLTLFGFHISHESLEWMRGRGLPSACWWINDPIQFERSARKALYYDFVFSNSAACPPRYLEIGARAAHFLPTACSPDVHRPAPVQERYRCDVCFAGDWSEPRERVLEPLASRFHVRIFGPWARKLPARSPLRASLTDGFFSPSEMAQMFASASVVLNIHRWFGEYDNGLNPRVFEAAGCAAYQLVDTKREIPQLFDVPREMVCYSASEEIPALVEEALADPARARAIGAAAQRRAHHEHTYRTRMETLLGIVGKAGA